MYRFETFILDVSERRLYQGGAAVPLTPKVFDVLAYLVQRPGHLVEKEEILRAVWPDAYVEEANISRIVHTLRRTLGNTADGKRLIETVPKRGYRFTGNVTTISGSEEELAPVELSRGKPGARRSFWPLVSVAGLALVLVVAGGFLFRGGQPQQQKLSFSGMVPSRLTTSGDVLAPSVSPEGRSLVFIKHTPGGFGLQVRDLQTGIIRDVVPVRSGVRFWGVKFAPDGRSIYYIENKDNDLGTLYRGDSYGGEPVKIAVHVSGGPIASPDGRQVAFVRADKVAGKAWLIIFNNEDQTERTLVTTDTNDLFMSLDWRPDGANITYVLRTAIEGKPRFSIIDKQIDSGEERQIGETVENPIIMALWLTGMEGLVVNAIDSETKLPQIYFRSFPDGTESRITNDLSYYNYISKTRDAQAIFTQKVEQDRHIWLQPDVSNPAATQLTFEKEQHPDAVDWLDSDTLIYDPDLNGSHRARNLWTLDTNAKTPVVLTKGRDDNTIARTSPDGGFVTFISSRGGTRQLWRMSADASDAVQITDIPHRIFDQDHSPDGRWVYLHYSSGGEGILARMPVTGGELTEIGGKEIYQWALSPDGKRLAYSTPDEETGKFVIRVRFVEDPTTIQRFAVEINNCLVWSKDGKYLYFVADADQRRNIWRQPLAGGEPTPVTDFKDAEILDFAESPDARSFAIVRSKTSFDAVRFDFSK